MRSSAPLTCAKEFFIPTSALIWNVLNKNLQESIQNR